MTSIVSMSSLEEGVGSGTLCVGGFSKIANGASGAPGPGNAPYRTSNCSATVNNNAEELRAVPIAVEPPDGGYGWMVVFASFMCNLIVDGIAYTFGLFLPELVSSFESTKSVITWAGSLLSGFYLSAGPLVSALTNRFGCRKVCIAGSLMACISLCATTLASSVPSLLLFYGVFAGTGFSLIYLPAIISVNQYFSHKRATATGVAVCGSGLGAFVFAPLVQYLLEIFAWRGALLILAGERGAVWIILCSTLSFKTTGATGKKLLIFPSKIFLLSDLNGALQFIRFQENQLKTPVPLALQGLVLNCCIFGALMRPLQMWTTTTEKPLMQRIWEEKTGLLRQDSIGQSQFFLVQHPDGTVERRLKAGVNTEPGVHSTLFLDQWGKASGSEGPPPLTLSPIEEFDPKGKSNGSQPPVNGVPSHISNHTIQNIARRKGLIASHSAAKLTMSASSSTVQPEIQRNYSTPKFAMGASRSSIHQHLPLSAHRGIAGVNLIQGGGCNAPQVPAQHFNPIAASNNFNNHEMRRSIKDLGRPMYRKDIFYSGSIRNLPEFRQSSGDVRSYIASVLTLPGENPVPLGKTSGSSLCSCLPSAMSDTLGDIFDPALLSNPAFVIICLSNLIGMMGFNIPFVFIADAAVTMAKVDKEAASLLVSCIGITNMLGRLLFGRISDSPHVNSLTVNNVTLAISGIAVAITPLALVIGGYTAAMTVCALFGFMVAAYILLTSIILVDLLGLERLTNAFGLLCLVRGCACILGIPFAGILYDLTGSYQCPFIVSGIMLAASGAIAATVPYVRNPHKIIPPPPEEFMSPLEEIPEEESFTEDESSPENTRRRIPHDLEDSVAEEERTSLVEDDEDDLPMTINCDPRPEASSSHQEPSGQEELRKQSFRRGDPLS
ncbi:uncharacterized protein LOC111250277 isoform X2 [Varroa destructor]|uniref:Uncharacterized protein n=1 Tax=Varroa destructor TaxID=109461 RepID=A0A7M7K629_VARDE|nr:uncharacterized protein LOC111250277 isoform X2 [Varroa destructor]